MTKAKSTFEMVPILKKMLYGDNPHVLVKMPHGKYERHYYKINEKNELLVYGKSREDEASLHNPTVKGKPTYDSDGRFLLRWTYGEDFAYPIDSQVDFRESLNTDLKIQTAFTIGKMYNLKGAKKSPFDDPMMIVLILVLLAVVINLVMSYMGFTSLDANFLGGQ